MKSKYKLKNNFNIEVCNIKKEPIALITNNSKYSAFEIELSSNEDDVDTLKFNIHKESPQIKSLVNENFVLMDGEFYTIKRIVETDDDMNSIECEHDVCIYKEKLNSKFEMIGSSPKELIEAICTETTRPTFLRYGGTDIVGKYRSLITDEQSIFANLTDVASKFAARLTFKRIGEYIYVYLLKNPVDKGRVLIKNKDLNSVSIDYDSSSMYTILHYFGGNDDLTGNEITMQDANPTGKSYIEDYSFWLEQGYTEEELKNIKSDHIVREHTIRNTDLTTSEQVYEMALQEMETLCRPNVEVSCDLTDISVIEAYKVEPLEKGEKVTIVDKDKKIKLEAIVKSLSKNSKNPLDVTVTLSNSINTFNPLKSIINAAQVVNKVTNGSQNVQGNSVMVTRTKKASDGIKNEGKTITKSLNASVDTLVETDAKNLQEAKEYSTETLNNGHLGSHVVVRKVDDSEGEILVMDSPDIATAQQVWRWNVKGLGFSNNGYRGDYGLAITNDGQIVADKMTTGVLSAITIQNADGSVEIDLGNKNGVRFKNNGHNTIDLVGNNILFYDWEGSNRTHPVGRIYSARSGGDINKPGIAMAHEDDSYMAIAYKRGDAFYPYVSFDYNKILTKETYQRTNYISRGSVLFRQPVEFLTRPFYPYGFYMGEFENVGIFPNALGGININPKKGEKVYVDGDIHVLGKITSSDSSEGGTTPTQQKIVESARKLLGKPYVFGGNYPPLGTSGGTDCSGLCQWAYNDNGIKISRTTYTQIQEGVEVQQKDLQVGDLVFTRFEGSQPEHVVMYSKYENGIHYCIEAPRTGLNIRERELIWEGGYRARRIVTKTTNSVKSFDYEENKFLKEKIEELEKRLDMIEKIITK